MYCGMSRKHRSRQLDVLPDSIKSLSCSQCELNFFSLRSCSCASKILFSILTLGQAGTKTLPVSIVKLFGLLKHEVSSSDVVSVSQE